MTRDDDCVTAREKLACVLFSLAVVGGWSALILTIGAVALAFFGQSPLPR